MSKYTTELRFILETYAGLDESEGNDNVNEIITKGLPKLFNFDFPIFDEAYREVLERKIVRHYYTREIGYETVGRWKLALENKLNEIMPYYNKLYNSELLEFNPLYTHNITKTGSRTDSEEKHETGNKTENNTLNKNFEHTSDEHHNNSIGHNGHESSSNSSNDTKWALENDTPQGGLTGVENLEYLSNATKNTDTASSSASKSDNYDDTDIGIKENNALETTNTTGQNTSNTTKQGTAQNTGEYLETIVGYEGKNASKSLLEYRQTFLNIDVQIINELNNLFMLVW